MKSRWIYVLSACWLSVGCATHYKVNLDTAEGQKSINANKTHYIASEKQAYVAVAAPNQVFSSRDRLPLLITVINPTKRPLMLNTDNIKAYVDGKPHKIYSFQELSKELFAASRKNVEDYAEDNHIIQDYGDIEDRELAQQTGDYWVSPDGALDRLYSEEWDEFDRLLRSEEHSKFSSETFASAGDASKVLRKNLLTRGPIRPSHGKRGYIILDGLKATDTVQDIKLVISIKGDDHEFSAKVKKVQNL